VRTICHIKSLFYFPSFSASLQGRESLIFLIYRLDSLHLHQSVSVTISAETHLRLLHTFILLDLKSKIILSAVRVPDPHCSNSLRCCFVPHPLRFQLSPSPQTKRPLKRLSNKSSPNHSVHTISKHLHIGYRSVPTILQQLLTGSRAAASRQPLSLRSSSVRTPVVECILIGEIEHLNR
jgi:hypothetical protein